MRNSPGEMLNPFPVSVPFICNGRKFNSFFMKGTLAGSGCNLASVTYDGAFLQE